MTESTTATFRTLDTSERLPDNYVNPYYLPDLKRRVAVARVRGALYAFDEQCTHAACPLSAGLLTGSTLMCQCDGSRFDITSGAVLQGPAPRPLTTYQVREQDGEIQVAV